MRIEASRNTERWPPSPRRDSPEKLAVVRRVVYGPIMRGEERSDPHLSPFLAFVYDLGRRRCTGVLSLGGRGGTLSIHEGGAVLAETDVLGRHASEELARAAAPGSKGWDFQPEIVRIQWGSLPLARWVRLHTEREVGRDLAARLTADVGGARIALRAGAALDLEHLDATDRLLAGALERARPASELGTVARAPRFRLLAFLHFLRSIGALAMLPDGASLRGSPARDGRASPPAGSRTASIQSSTPSAFPSRARLAKRDGVATMGR